MTRITRRSVLASLLVTSLLLSLLSGAASASTPERVGPPDSMASLGDSITRGFHSGGLLADVPANSWSTGTNATVDSIYNRLKALNPGITQTNNALTGAKMNDLARQASTVAPGTDLVTILLGANDVCTSTEAGMTPVATYESQLRAGMEVLAANNSDALVYVASIPSIYRLWQIGSVSATARLWWGIYGICQSMLAQPTSTTAVNVDRPARVQQRVVDFNATLERVCGEYLRCRFDGNAAFNTPFVLSDMSGIDYFHPNVTGQRKAASVLAGALFDFTDVEAPTTVVSTSRDADGSTGGSRARSTSAFRPTHPTCVARSTTTASPAPRAT